VERWDKTLPRFKDGMGSYENFIITGDYSRGDVGDFGVKKSSV